MQIQIKSSDSILKYSREGNSRIVPHIPFPAFIILIGYVHTNESRNYSISSNWVTFENDYSDSEIYVTSQPQVKVVKVRDENDSSKNYYKVFIKKLSNIILN